jgi:hypothetical protein
LTDRQEIIKPNTLNSVEAFPLNIIEDDNKDKPEEMPQNYLKTLYTLINEVKTYVKTTNLIDIKKLQIENLVSNLKILQTAIINKIPKAFSIIYIVLQMINDYVYTLFEHLIENNKSIVQVETINTQEKTKSFLNKHKLKDFKIVLNFFYNIKQLMDVLWMVHRITTQAYNNAKSYYSRHSMTIAYNLCLLYITVKICVDLNIFNMELVNSIDDNSILYSINKFTSNLTPTEVIKYKNIINNYKYFGSLMPTISNSSLIFNNDWLKLFDNDEYVFGKSKIPKDDINKLFVLFKNYYIINIKILFKNKKK